MILNNFFTVDNFLKIAKFFKPEFYNKITWLVVGSGLALLAGKPLLEVLLSAYLEKYFALSISNQYDSLIGVGLVVFGLVYNLFATYLSRNNKSENVSQILKHDKKLFQEFLQDLPSSSNGIILLKEHDFGAPFHKVHLEPLNSFYFKWNNAEYEFLDTDIEVNKKTLIKDIAKLINSLATNAFPNGEMLTTRIDKENSNISYEAIKSIIKSLNELSNKIYSEYENFIKTTKVKIYQ